MTDEVVTRLYRSLVEALRRRGHRGEQPVKVSEIYKDLVPYQSVRSALGVELNADYEHALLRLLAGERDLLRLEPEEAREELRKEVATPYPFVGLFRKFSSSKVWVKLPPGYTPVESDDRPPLRLAVDTGAGSGSVGSAAAERAPVRLHSDPPGSASHGAASPGEQPCTFCGERLPEGRRVRFCPHCGGDQRLQPCPRCEAVLEREWRFCISCGQEVSG